LKLPLFFVFDTERVTIGSAEHLIPVSLAIVFAVFFIRHAKHKLSEKHQNKALFIFSLLVSLIVLSFHLYYIILGTYNFNTDLPLFLCSLMALFMPVFAYYRKYWMFEILLFWIIAGTFHGIITPDIAVGYPSFDYFRFWTVHLGLQIIIFYAVFVFNMRPKLISVFKSIIASQIYMAIMMTLNYFLNANYSYLNYKPTSASVLDYLGEWPWYLLQVQLILIPYCLLIYAAFKIGKKPKKTT